MSIALVNLVAAVRCCEDLPVRPIRIVAAFLGAAALLVACGESDEEKAQDRVCDARADIEQRLDDLAELTPTTVSVERVTNNLEAIRDDLEKIAAEREELAPEQRRAVEEAGDRFRSQLETTARDFVSGATTGEEARAGVKSALEDLATSFREAYGPVDCG
jgi:DNA repair exonuclease SbcCD ATPase subunit